MRALKAAAITVAYFIGVAAWFGVLDLLDHFFGLWGPLGVSGAMMVLVVFGVTYYRLENPAQTESKSLKES